MQKFLLFALLCAFSQPLCAQEQQKTYLAPPEYKQSKLEVFMGTSGKLLEKKFIRIGQVRGIQVELMKVKDLHTGDSLRGLRISSPQTLLRAALIDEAEIDTILQAAQDIQKNTAPARRKNYAEITYRDSTSLKIGAFYSLSAGLWRYSVQTNGFDRRTWQNLNKLQFARFIKLLEAAKKRL